MRTYKSLGETVLGMTMCFRTDGKVTSKCFGRQCPYFKYDDCISELRADALHHLVTALELEVNKMKFDEDLDKLNIRKGGD